MDEQQAKRSAFGGILWFLVIVAILVAWWYFRGRGAEDAKQVSHHADKLVLDAEAMAAADPDDILIDLKDDATPDAIERDLGLRLVLVDDSGVAAATKLYRAHVDPAKRDAILAQLSERDDVEIAEPDAEYALLPGESVAVQESPAPGEPGFPNDPLYKHQWHLRQIGMPEAWKLADGNGTIVAVLDTGVAYEDYKDFHLLPDLKGVTFVKPRDFVRGGTHANDDHAHGSHVTGTIAQATNNGIGVAGVARNVRIMPLKVLSGSGSGSVAGIADAIRYAADNGAKVINMSLGGAFPSKVLKKAVAYAHDKGVTVVCAAGNESKGRVGYPAAYPGAIAVSATQYDETITFYSNWGKDIDIAAPGGNTRVDQDGDQQPDGVLQNTIEVRNPKADGYFAFMGTSMASPHVAGVAALVVGEGITDPDKVEQVLKASARKPAKGYDVEKYGAGILDAPAAIKKARQMVADGDVRMAATDHHDGAPARRGGAWLVALGLLVAGAVASRRRTGIAYLLGVAVGAGGLYLVSPVLAALPLVNVIAFSAALPVAMLALGYGVERLRAPLAGVAVGLAAQLALLAVAPAASMGLPGLLGNPVWLLGNALACVGLARLALRR
ncbi:MAG: peptidase S8 [Deltaproteobacteria bacterium]|nr:peptidase S8 [Deltaproteobacteria bacterium]